ncbi:ORF6N domain-containing protein [bacterium]|nr:ORF6N domain-containing protein [bacterium]
MENDIVIHNETDLQSKIYTIRGMKVMLDSDLAEIYGYSVKAFNQQVKNNIEKFDEDFRFQLTKDEYHSILRCKNCTLENQDEILRSKILTLENKESEVIEEGQNLKSKFLTSSWGGVRKLPYAFTEQGIYMLMTVLKGDLATRQSKILIRLFKGMKDFIVDSGNLIGQSEGAKLAIQTSQNTKDIAIIKETMVTKAELTDFMKLFDTGIRNEEILILDGEPFKADFAYQKIYETAEHSIIVIDDYLGLKTLRHLASAKSGVQITIISDNKGKNPLKLTEYNDFLKEYPEVKIKFIASLGRIHDRYIAIDFGTKNEKLYHCGASSKDAGRRITTILEIKGIADYRTTLESLLSNRELKLNL